MASNEGVDALIASIEDEHVRLRDALSSRDEASLRKRPVSGKWSALENVRHLVFAEYVHFARFLHADKSWRKLEPLPPHGLEVQRGLKMIGGETTGLRDLLDTWRVVHESTRRLLEQDTDEVRKALTAHRTHLRTHVRQVERLMRAR